MRKHCNRAIRTVGPMLTANGERLYKSVLVTVVFPDNKKKVRNLHRAAPGQGFNANAIQEILWQWATKVEQDFYPQEFRLVELGPAEFNFVPAS